jgi:hypothetical protein
MAGQHRSNAVTGTWKERRLTAAWLHGVGDMTDRLARPLDLCGGPDAVSGGGDGLD